MKSCLGSWWMFFWKGKSTSAPAKWMRLCFSTSRIR